MPVRKPNHPRPLVTFAWRQSIGLELTRCSMITNVAWHIVPTPSVSKSTVTSCGKYGMSLRISDGVEIFSHRNQKPCLIAVYAALSRQV